MILSNARTTNVLLAGQKTCTRRVWSERTARAWVNAYKSDRLIHAAWDKCSFVKGAKKIADIKLTQSPYQERLKDMPQSDLDAEGGLWASREEFINLFGSPGIEVWVVRFRLVMPTRGQTWDGSAARKCERVDIAPISALELGHATNAFAPSEFSFPNRDAKGGFTSDYHLNSTLLTKSP